jgi:hypothetical protein
MCYICCRIYWKSCHRTCLATYGDRCKLPSHGANLPSRRRLQVPPTRTCYPEPAMAIWRGRTTRLHVRWHPHHQCLKMPPLRIRLALAASPWTVPQSAGSRGLHRCRRWLHRPRPENGAHVMYTVFARGSNRCCLFTLVFGMLCDMLPHSSLSTQRKAIR